MRGLQDKTVLITGGARGIGAALCRRFANEGARVVVFDVLGDEAHALAAALSPDGSRVRAYAVDITDRRAVSAAVAQAEADLAPIECWSTTQGSTGPAALSTASHHSGSR